MVSITCSALILLLYWAALASVQTFHHTPESLRQKRSLSFPPDGSAMGIIVAIAVPLSLEDTNLFFSYNFEANYNLPDNLTAVAVQLEQVIEPDAQRSEARSFDRRMAYTVLEQKLNSHGYPGKSCILRTICEVAETPIRHNGVLGDIMHIIFTPSASQDEGLSPEFQLAEETGQTGDCSQYEDTCPMGLLDYFSTIRHL